MRRRFQMTGAAIALMFALGAPAAAQAAPNDPFYGLQWGQQQLHTEPAWTTSTGAGQTIAIVDAGIELSHPDLAGKIVGGATFTGCATNPDGCGNGDWQSAPSAGPPSPHGTHVAGIAAATTNNGVGVAGTAPDAKLLAVKVLTDDGGSFEEIAAGIRWSADHGADVINMSLGALPGVQALEITGAIADAKEAIDYARSKGVVVVAAAGNDFASICGSPSFSDGALCVTSTDRNEQRSSLSNFGVKPSMDAVAAPGGAGLVSCPGRHHLDRAAERPQRRLRDERGLRLLRGHLDGHAARRGRRRAPDRAGPERRADDRRARVDRAHAGRRHARHVHAAPTATASSTRRRPSPLRKGGRGGTRPPGPAFQGNPAPAGVPPSARRPSAARRRGG